MRILLTFILCLMGVSVFGQPVQRGPYTTNTIPRLEVVNPANRNLTNIVWQNNMEVQLTAGTNTISTVLVDPESDDAHMQITAKTNITIRGLGPNSVIWSGSTGTFFRVSHSHNITFEDLTIEGTRAPDAALPGMTTLWGAVMFVGTNSQITFRNVHFKNHTDHGLVQLSQTYPKNSSYVLTENCTFENVGTTNAAYGASAFGDGVAVNIVGPNQTIRNSTFINCAHAIEFEGVAATTIKNVLIEGNRFIGGGKQSIVDFGADPFTDVMIRGNVFEYDKTTYWSLWAYAIRLHKGKRVNIIDNIIVNAAYGIEVSANTSSDQWLIADNTVSGTLAQGIIVTEVPGGRLEGVTVVNNTLSRTGYEGIRVQGGRNIVVEGNTLNDVCTNFAGLGAISLYNFGGGALTVSNSVLRNKVFNDPDSTPNIYGYGLHIDGAGVTHTKVEGNDFSGYATSAINDAGTSTVQRDNWEEGTFQRGDGGGSGDVTAAANFDTDEVLIRADGTGKGVQKSGVTLTDANDVAGINDLVVGNDALIGNNLDVVGTVTAPGFVGSGSGNAYINLPGATAGSIGIVAPASGQSNNIIPHISNPAVGDILKAFSNTLAGPTNNTVWTNISIGPFTNSYDGAIVRVPANALAKEVQVLVATNDFLLLWTNQVSGKLLSLSIYNNTATNITLTHHGGVRFMGGASNVVAAGRELAVAAKFIGTNISLSFAPQTN